MNRVRFIAAIVAIFTSFAFCSAQTRELTEGQEFYFGIPNCKKPAGEKARGVAPVQLWISSKVQTKAVIKADAVGMNYTVSILPNEVKVLALPDNLMMTESEIVKNYGVSVTSEAPVTVTVVMSYRVTGESFRILPVSALGQKYVTLNMYQDKTEEFKPAQILIVAAYDNTAITYIPTAHTDKTAAGSARTVMLKKGDTYLILGKIQAGLNQDKATDLTGTYIESDKPIAVYSGHTKGAFPRYQPTMLGTPANFMRNMLFETMLPVEILGTEYVTAPIKYNNRPYTAADSDQKGDLIRFVATEDATVITQMKADGSGFKNISMVMKKGQFFDITSQESAGYYKSNFPVLVGQYGKAWRSTTSTLLNKYKDEILNPSRCGTGMLMVIPPINRWISYAAHKSLEEVDNFVMIILKTAEIDSIKFDNNPLRAEFNGILKVEGTQYSYAIKQVSAGGHTFASTHPTVKFSAFFYGNYDNTKDGFAYGSAAAINYSIDCDEKIVFKSESSKCGNITGTAEISSVQNCGEITGISINADSSENYIFNSSALSPDFKKYSFEIAVKDSLQTGRALITIHTRSGKDTTFAFNFIGTMALSTPQLLDFGVIKQNTIHDKKITIQNAGNSPVTINRAFFKNNSKDFKILTTFPLTIPANSSIEIIIRTTPLILKYKQDRLVVETDCFSREIQVMYFGKKQDPNRFWPPPAK